MYHSLTPFQKFELGLSMKRAKSLLYCNDILRVDDKYYKFRRSNDLRLFAHYVISDSPNRWCVPFKRGHPKSALCIKIHHYPAPHNTGWWYSLPKPWPQ